MKKIKVLATLTSAVMLSGAATSLLTSCSCSTNIKELTVEFVNPVKYVGSVMRPSDFIVTVQYKDGTSKELKYWSPYDKEGYTVTCTQNSKIKMGHEFNRDDVGQLYELTFIYGETTTVKPLRVEMAQQLKVQFDTNGGSAIETQLVAAGGVATKPTKNPEKTGYTFKGWFTAAEGGSEFDFSKAISTNTTIYAQWEINKYQITWLNDDGTVIDTTNVEYNSMPTHADPTKPGSESETFVFNGWEPALAPASQDTSYKAKFKATKNTYVVTFDSVSGTSVVPQTIEHGEKIAKPTTTRTGYTFLGWFTEGGIEWNFDSDVVTANTKLIAHWQVNKFTVSFNSMGGSPTPGDITNIEYNTTIPEASKPANPTREHYSFKNWMFNGSEFKFGDGGTVVKDSITLIANYDGLSYHTVTYDMGDGSTYITQSIEDGAKAVKPVSDPVKEGYSFAGWYKDATTPWDFDNDTVSADTTITAHWTINKFTVTFNSMDGTAVPATTDVEYNTTIAAPTAPTRDHFTFKGWLYNGEEFKFGTGGTPVKGNITLYAKWESLPKYSVIFDVDGGSAVTQQLIEQGSTAAKPASNPTKTGYTFVNWYDAKTGGNVFDFDNTKITANTTIFAHWEINKYTVTFDSDGGTAVAAKENVEYNTTITAPTAPTKTHYTFDGWYLGKTKFVFEGETGTATPVTDNITLVARWTPVSTFTVTFNSDGGTQYESVTVYDGETVSNPGSPTKTGYTFVNWYDAATGGNVFDFTKGITKNTIIYARYTVNVMTVKFNSHGGSTVADIQANYGSTITAPTAPTRDTYTFAGWYEDEAYTKVFGFSTPITKDMTLHAKWTLNQYTVTFNTHGGSSINSVIVNHGDKVDKPVDPTYGTNIFDGWYTDEAYTTPYDFTSAVTQSLTLHAKWATQATSISISGATDKQEFDVSSSSNVEVALTATVSPSTALQNCTWSFTTTNSNITFDTSSHKVTAPKDAVGIVDIKVTSDTTPTVYNTIQLRFYETTLTGLTWTLQSDDTYLVSADSSTFTSSNLVVPTTYNGKSISLISAENCTSLTSVALPEGITTLKHLSGTAANSFYGCSSLQKVILPDSLTTINSYSFYNCSSLEEITIPKGVTSLNPMAFIGCTGLKTINVSSDNSTYASTDNAITSKDGSTLVSLWPSTWPSYTTPTAITSVGNSAFAYSNASNVTLSNNVTSLGTFAFQHSKVSNVVLSSGLDTISSGCFFDCINLSSVTIPSSIKTINANAFSGSGLSTLDLSNVTTLSDYALTNMTSLTSLTLNSALTSIPRCGLKGCSKLQSVTLPSSLTSIGENAFEECNALASITIPSGVTAIPSGCFYNCNTLSSVTISGNITSIGSMAFAFCTSLQNISLPASITSIELGAFGRSGGFQSGINKVNFAGTKAQWGAITLNGTAIGTTTRPDFFPSDRNIYIICSDETITYAKS